MLVAGEKEPGDTDGLALAQGRGLIGGLVVIEGEDGQRDRLFEMFLTQQGGEDGAHLLEAEGDLAASFLASIGDHSEMGGVDFEPRVGVGSRSGKAKSRRQQS